MEVVAAAMAGERIPAALSREAEVVEAEALSQ